VRRIIDLEIRSDEEGEEEREDGLTPPAPVEEDEETEVMVKRSHRLWHKDWQSSFLLKIEL
jgi:hypothetical protein